MDVAQAQRGRARSELARGEDLELPIARTHAPASLRYDALEEHEVRLFELFELSDAEAFEHARHLRIEAVIARNGRHYVRKAARVSPPRADRVHREHLAGDKALCVSSHDEAMGRPADLGHVERVGSEVV